MFGGTGAIELTLKEIREGRRGGGKRRNFITNENTPEEKIPAAEVTLG